MYGVISRRSIDRAGTRYWQESYTTRTNTFLPRRLFIRGIDDDGRVANYVETEQILQLSDTACSYVQVNERRYPITCVTPTLPFT